MAERGRLPIKILLIDDDEDDFVLLRDTINKISVYPCPCELSWSPIDEIALSRLVSEKFDLIMAEYSPRIVHEKAILKHILILIKDAPVIVLTDWQSPIMEKNQPQLPYQAMLSKESLSDPQQIILLLDMLSR